MRGAERSFARIADIWPGAPISTLLYDGQVFGERLAGHDLVISSSSAFAHGVQPASAPCTSVTATRRFATPGTSKQAGVMQAPRPARLYSARSAFE